MKFKKALSWVAGQPAGEIRILPAPTQAKEEDLTNSIANKLRNCLSLQDSKFPTSQFPNYGSVLKLASLKRYTKFLKGTL